MLVTAFPGARGYRAMSDAGRVNMVSSTTAAVVEAAGKPFEVLELELNDLRSDEILVAIEAVGICHTDLAAAHQAIPLPVPIVLGHEGVGRIVAVGSDGLRLEVGSRVLLSAPSCGRCRYCVSGQPRYCPSAVPLAMSGGRLDGTTAFRRDGRPVHSHFSGQSSFCSHAVALASTAVAIPEDLPAEIAAPFGCGIATGAGAVINVLRPAPDSSLVVVGAGPVGLAAVMAARLVGCGDIIVADLVPSRLELARELGATETIDATREAPVERVVELTAGGADFVIQAAPSTKLLEDAVDMAGPGGVVAVVGAGPHEETASVHPIGLVSGPKTIRGVKGGEGVPERLVSLLVEQWRKGRLPVERLVCAYDFDDINRAAASMQDGTVLKPVLRL